MNINIIKIKNNTFKTTINHWKAKVSDSPVIQNQTIEDLIIQMRNSKDIYEKQYGDISSFNFKKNVFYSGNWSELSKLARGLFINTHTNEIVARGYEKFFNYKEGKFNQPVWLNTNLQFPVIAYHKYNGFLGLLGFDNDREDLNKLIYFSKSSPESDFAKWFYEIFHQNIKDQNINEYILKLESFMKNKNICLIFEVIDPINDPHIVDYPTAKIVLLGAIYRTIDFKEVSYEELKEIAKIFGFEVKKQEYIFNNWNELEKFINNASENMEHIEGFVLEDANHYMFKLKVKWYKIWKHLRTIKDHIAKGHSFKTGFAQTPLENYFIKWCKDQSRELLFNNDIITLRKRFEIDSRLAYIIVTEKK